MVKSQRSQEDQGFPWKKLGVALLVMLGIAWLIYQAFAPRYEVEKDPITGKYMLRELHLSAARAVVAYHDKAEISEEVVKKYFDGKEQGFFEVGLLGGAILAVMVIALGYGFFGRSE